MTIHRQGPLTRPGRATEAGLASTEDLPNEQFGATLPVYYPALVRLPPQRRRLHPMVSNTTNDAQRAQLIQQRPT